MIAENYNLNEIGQIRGKLEQVYLSKDTVSIKTSVEGELIYINIPFTKTWGVKALTRFSTDYLVRTDEFTITDSIAHHIEHLVTALNEYINFNKNDGGVYVTMNIEKSKDEKYINVFYAFNPHKKQEKLNEGFHTVRPVKAFYNKEYAQFSLQVETINNKTYFLNFPLGTDWGITAVKEYAKEQYFNIKDYTSIDDLGAKLVSNWKCCWKFSLRVW